MILAKQNVVTKSPAPKIAPSERKMPSELPDEAEYDASTSGAPFAKAKRVTPAIVSLN